jgi:hypothetical protein
MRALSRNPNFISNNCIVYTDLYVNLDPETLPLDKEKV